MSVVHLLLAAGPASRCGDIGHQSWPLLLLVLCDTLCMPDPWRDPLVHTVYYFHGHLIAIHALTRRYTASSARRVCCLGLAGLSAVLASRMRR
ncbi:hypothetical protein T440DRAFT_171845 [Plenodomus tracheiphilus IPT5]|uniref:Uncharacterized protein n=1 Tax=Plenodomus tracheiphilus IPT5 TaxID=1408161 RepID=A0A6A7B040_9PLEO|nr:hypothetical protein T440DRAFT_171845 [Plenodomus tracheiphilus IPT5]